MLLKRKLCLVAIALLALTACSDDDLKTIARSLRNTSAAIGTAQTITIHANMEGLLTTESTGQILAICSKVNQAGLQVVATTKDVAQMKPEDRQNVVQLLDPVINSVADLSGSLDKLGVKDEKLKTALTATFLVVQSSLLEAKIAAVGKPQ